MECKGQRKSQERKLPSGDIDKERWGAGGVRKGRRKEESKTRVRVGRRGAWCRSSGVQSIRLPDARKDRGTDQLQMSGGMVASACCLWEGLHSQLAL